MKVLHVYPKSDALILHHVQMLNEGLRQSVDTYTADSYSAFRQAMKGHKPDIVHVHGCTHFFLTRVLRSARRAGIRTVLSLHGQLEPWTINQQSTQEKANRLLLLKEAIIHTYAIITFGRLERSNFEDLGWNRRIEEIHNAVITNTITPIEMCAQTFTVYQRILDSNTLGLMDNLTHQYLKAIIKAGILGDQRWVDEVPTTSPDWRHILVYAEHENIRNYVDYGINILGLSTPMLDTSRISAYFPDKYVMPHPIKEIAGDYQGDENEYVVRMIKQISKRPLLLHLIELTRELYRDSIDDERLSELLESKGLKEFAGRLMQVLGEETGLNEGYMPILPINDKKTEHLRRIIANHLKI